MENNKEEILIQKSGSNVVERASENLFRSNHSQIKIPEEFFTEQHVQDWISRLNHLSLESENSLLYILNYYAKSLLGHLQGQEFLLGSAQGFGLYQEIEKLTDNLESEEKLKKNACHRLALLRAYLLATKTINNHRCLFFCLLVTWLLRHANLLTYFNLESINPAPGINKAPTKIISSQHLQAAIDLTLDFIKILLHKIDYSFLENQLNSYAHAFLMLEYALPNSYNIGHRIEKIETAIQLAKLSILSNESDILDFIKKSQKHLHKGNSARSTRYDQVLLEYQIKICEEIIKQYTTGKHDKDDLFHKALDTCFSWFDQETFKELSESAFYKQFGVICKLINCFGQARNNKASEFVDRALKLIATHKNRLNIQDFFEQHKDQVIQLIEKKFELSDGTPQKTNDLLLKLQNLVGLDLGIKSLPAEIAQRYTPDITSHYNTTSRALFGTDGLYSSIRKFSPAAEQQAKEPFSDLLDIEPLVQERLLFLFHYLKCASKFQVKSEQIFNRTVVTWVINLFELADYFEKEYVDPDISYLIKKNDLPLAIKISLLAIELILSKAKHPLQESVKKIYEKFASLCALAIPDLYNKTTQKRAEMAIELAVYYVRALRSGNLMPFLYSALTTELLKKPVLVLGNALPIARTILELQKAVAQQLVCRQDNDNRIFEFASASPPICQEFVKSLLVAKLSSNKTHLSWISGGPLPDPKQLADLIFNEFILGRESLAKFFSDSEVPQITALIEAVLNPNARTLSHLNQHVSKPELKIENHSWLQRTSRSRTFFARSVHPPELTDIKTALSVINSSPSVNNIDSDTLDALLKAINSYLRSLPQDLPYLNEVAELGIQVCLRRLEVVVSQLKNTEEVEKATSSAELESCR